MLSIITPTLNAESYIESNILEIKKLNISYEHIIVDGGSQDDTLNIISKHKEIIVIHQNDCGGMYSEISTEPYKTDEVHGRGVLVSRSVYDTWDIGLEGVSTLWRR